MAIPKWVGTDGWKAAVFLCQTYLRNPQKSDVLLERLSSDFPGVSLRRCHALFFGVIRNLKLIERAVDTLISKKPKRRLKSILFVSAFELLGSDPTKHPKIVHSGVGRALELVSPREASLVNAVLKRLPDRMGFALAAIGKDSSPTVVELALAFSHPDWLVERWVDSFGMDHTGDLLRWNQEPPPVLVWIADSVAGPADPSLETTRWPHFFRFRGGKKDDLKDLLERYAGIVADPASLRPVSLLNPQAGEKILNLCAAPGTKSLMIARQFSGSQGLLVSLDLPGVGFRKLVVSAHSRGTGALLHEMVMADLLSCSAETMAFRGLPALYDAVLLDAPCTNTGVFRRRPDARWRIQPEDIEAAASKQQKMLHRASEFVAPGGRLVYCTCSLEPEENSDVTKAFFQSRRENWELIAESRSFPWSSGHDGGCAFLFQRIH